MLAALLAPPAAPARAAAEDNGYPTQGQAVPHAGGAPDAAVPVAVALTASAVQPRPLKRVTWTFDGLRATAGTQAPEIVGTLDAVVYDADAPDVALPCTKSLRAAVIADALRIVPGGEADACAGVAGLAPWPVSLEHGAVQIEFPADTRHPAPGLVLALRSLTLTVQRGALESIGCAGDRRALTTSFTDEADVTASAAGSDACGTAGDPANTARPVVAPAAPGPGDTARCSSGSWTNEPDGYEYAWLRDGTVIEGASSPAYAVGAGDAGSALSCRVTARKGLLALAAASAPVAVASPAPSPPPTAPNQPSAAAAQHDLWVGAPPAGLGDPHPFSFPAPAAAPPGAAPGDHAGASPTPASKGALRHEGRTTTRHPRRHRRH